MRRRKGKGGGGGWGGGGGGGGGKGGGGGGRYGGLGISRDVDPSPERGREDAPVERHGAREHLRRISQLWLRGLFAARGPGAAPPLPGGWGGAYVDAS